jgi:hypothetical protein
MSHPPVRRSLAVLMLAAILLVPCAASAAPRSTGELRTPSSGFLPQLWSLIAGLWPDAGCILDPSGLCKGTQGTAAPVPPASLDEGCGIDPDGRCKGTQGTAAPKPASLDEGCILDPNGRCGSSR